MDPYDRLRRLNQSNPPIRSAAAPVYNVGGRRVNIKNTAWDAGRDKLTPIQPSQSIARNVGDFTKNVAEAIADPFVRTAKKAGQQFSYLSGPRQNRAEDLLNTQEQAQQRKLRPETEQLFKGVGFEAGNTARKMVVNGTKEDDIVKYLNEEVAKKNARDKAALGTAVQVASYAVPASKGLSIPTRVASDAAAGAVSNAAGTIATDPNASGKDVGISALTGGIFGGLLGGATAAGGRLLKGSSKKLAEKLVGETDPAAIKLALGVDDEMANFLAQEKNPDTLKALIDELDINNRKAGKKLKENPKTNDLPAEDIKAIEEAGGVVPKVSEDTTIHLPSKGIYAKVTPEQAAWLKNEVANLKSSGDDIVHLSAPTKNLEKNAKEVSIEDIMKESPNAKASLEGVKTAEPMNQVAAATPVENAPQAAVNAEQAIQEAAPTQAGVADVPQTAPVANAETVGQTVSANADESAKVINGATPEVQDAANQVITQLKSAKGQFDDAEKIRSKERAGRIAKGTGSYEAAGGGTQGVQAKLGALKGKYSESSYVPIDATPEVKKALLDDIEKSGMREFEKLNTQIAVSKIFGDVAGKPTPGDIALIRKHFGNEFADQVQEHAAQFDKLKEGIAALAATPKAAMATADLSAPLRQGGVLGTRFPKEWAQAAKESVEFFGSESKFNAAMKEISERPTYELMKKAKLAVDGADGITGTEEQFMSSLLESDAAKKLLVGKVTAASDRGYTGFLTKFRADTFDKIIADTTKAGVTLDDKAISSIAEFINSASGRGNLGSLEKHAGLLSKALFSPRLWKSRLDLLNPVYYAKLDPVARKYALQASASFATTAATVLGLASAAGATVVWDPRSADFAKIKVGNTRYDILGGLQQNIRLGAQMITGEKIDSTTGELSTLGPDRGFGKPSRKDLLYQFFENKENPLVAYATKLLEGSDAAGNPINPTSEAAKLLIPLNAQSIYETAKDTGNIPKAVAMNAPGVFGVGVQTYGSIASKDKGPNGEFTGKVTPDMVTDKNGNVLTDDKGRPVKVKFPENASDLEKKALIDDKRKAALTAQYKRTLSADDQSLLKLTNKQLEGYVSDGTITQDKYDSIQDIRQDIDNLDGVNVPKGAKSDYAKKYFETYNSMTKKEKDAYLNAEADDNAIAVTKKLNKERSKGLSEFKPSNKLAKAYAEFENDINTHPEYTSIDKANKTKGFQAFAYKLNYGEVPNDIYREGGTDDLKNLIDNNSIDKKDLDQAIKMDEELYLAGITGRLKFSKEFRGTYGYGVPSGGGSGGSGGSSNNAHLGALLSGISIGGGPDGAKMPSFSAKSRISPKKSTSYAQSPGKNKRISIKL